MDLRAGEAEVVATEEARDYDERNSLLNDHRKSRSLSHESPNSTVSDPLSTTSTPSSNASSTTDGESSAHLESWDWREEFRKDRTFFLIVCLTACIEGLEELSTLALSFWYKDNLHVTPAVMGFAQGLKNIPWVIKPVWGFISDGLPILGYRRKSYLIIFGVTGACLWLVMAYKVKTLGGTIGVQLCIAVCVAFVNVVAKGLLVEKAGQRSQKYCSWLLSIHYMTVSFFSVIASYWGGFLLEYISNTQVFALVSIFPMLIVIVTPFLSETKQKPKYSPLMKRIPLFIADPTPLTPADIAEFQAIEQTDTGSQELLDRIPLHPKYVNFTEFLSAARSISQTSRQQAIQYLLDPQCKILSSQAKETLFIPANESKTPPQGKGENDGNKDKDDGKRSDSPSPPPKEDEGDNQGGVVGRKVMVAEVVNAIAVSSGAGPATLAIFQKMEEKDLCVRSIDDLMRLTEKTFKEEEKKGRPISASSQFWTLVHFMKAPIPTASGGSLMLWQPLLFIFLFSCTPSYSAAMFFFFTNRLGFKPEFMGRVSLVGGIFSLLGVYVYQRWLSHTSFRTILCYGGLLSAIVSSSMLLLVTRTNREMGIPDGAFLLGDQAIVNAVGTISFFPVLVMAARVCPEGVEGTMFALFMSVHNLGSILSQSFGSGLTELLGITSKNFTNLWLLICICIAVSVTPLPFLFCLVPAKDSDTAQGTTIRRNGNDRFRSPSPTRRGVRSISSNAPTIGLTEPQSASKKNLYNGEPGHNSKADASPTDDSSSSSHQLLRARGASPSSDHLGDASLPSGSGNGGGESEALLGGGGAPLSEAVITVKPDRRESPKKIKPLLDEREKSS